MFLRNPTTRPISIHSPLTGRDCTDPSDQTYGAVISIHSPLTGRDLILSSFSAFALLFQSTLPSRGETLSAILPCFRFVISIHSPLTGRDGGATVVDIKVALISIHSPLTGRDKIVHHKVYLTPEFQSTLPSRGETKRPGHKPRREGISIHSPLTGRDMRPIANWRHS